MNTSDIIGIVGDRGQGKTLLLVYLAARAHSQGRQVFSNIESMMIPRVYIPPGPLDLPRVSRAFFAIDELSALADSRTSHKEENRSLGFFLQQSRKRLVDFAFTAQEPHLVDRRVRDRVTRWIEVNKVKGRIVAQIFGNDGYMKKTLVIDPRPLYGMYDTYEVIEADL